MLLSMLNHYLLLITENMWDFAIVIRRNIRFGDRFREVLVEARIRPNLSIGLIALSIHSSTT